MIHSPDVGLVLVDFDDTLVDTAPRFLRARRELFDVLVGLGFDEDHVRNTHHEEIDPQMRRQFGLGPQRLEHAFRATYRHLTESAGLPVDESLAERCAAIGRTVAGVPPLLHGALDALRRLIAVFPTVLYTQSGDADYQLRCISGSGVLDVIGPNEFRICAQKTTDQFRAVLDEFGIADPARVWMIGNSMRSDINPALDCGANAIFVETDEAWEFDVVDPVHEEFYRVRSFSEAVDLLLAARRLSAS